MISLLLVAALSCPVDITALDTLRANIQTLGGKIWGQVSISSDMVDLLTIYEVQGMYKVAPSKGGCMVGVPYVMGPEHSSPVGAEPKAPKLTIHL